MDNLKIPSTCNWGQKRLLPMHKSSHSHQWHNQPFASTIPLTSCSSETILWQDLEHWSYYWLCVTLENILYITFWYPEFRCHMGWKQRFAICTFSLAFKSLVSPMNVEEDLKCVALFWFVHLPDFTNIHLNMHLEGAITRISRQLETIISWWQIQFSKALRFRLEVDEWSIRLWVGRGKAES